LAELIRAVTSDRNIRVHLETEVIKVDGFVGNFRSTLRSQEKKEEADHGVVVIATGAEEHKPTEYLYGQDPRIVTHLELDRMFQRGETSLNALKTVAFIQCVGSREAERPYCSRVCCTHSIDNAVELKKLNPEMNVYILYRDIRTYGEREYLYKEARKLGVIFIRYDLDSKPSVVLNNGDLTLQVTDPILGRPPEIRTDLLTLATAIVPNKEEALAQFYKVPLNDDGFFVEKHAKLGPSEFATDGVFLCGMAHYPKSIDESVVQGRAAAARAITLLARKVIHTSGTVAEIEAMNCSSCKVCISICPYSAPAFIEAGPFAGKAKINPVLCKGCGLCVASCRSGAIHLKGFDNDQIFAQIFAVNEAV
jgi:heterodisulfide reductase subunit A